MDKTIPFEKDAIRAYLDRNIRYWRKQTPKDPDFAYYYIDAYQSMRCSLFGERLPIEEQYGHKDV